MAQGLKGAGENDEGVSQLETEPQPQREGRKMASGCSEGDCTETTLGLGDAEGQKGAATGCRNGDRAIGAIGSS